MPRFRLLCVAFLICVFTCCLAAEDSAPAALTLIDAAGREISLDGVPQRLVVVGDGPFMVAHLLAMFPEGRTRLVAMERKGTSASAFLPLVDFSYPSKTFLAPNAGPEQIVGARPDLVLSRGSVEDATSRSLTRIGIPVALLGMESFERYLEDVALIGRVLGNPSRAREVLHFYESRLEGVRERVSRVPVEERPRVLLAMAIARGGRVAVQVPGASWIQTRMIEEAGGRPAWLEGVVVGNSWTVVTLEQIASWDPDWIFLVFWHSMEPERGLAGMRADPYWSKLRAVREGRFRAFPGDIYGWDSPDPRWILGLRWTAAMLHPELFPDYDVDEELGNFFGMLYGMSDEAVEESIRPAIRMKLD